MQESETVAELKNVTKQSRRCRALTRCTLKIKRGRIYGLVGKMVLEKRL